jgi:putative glutamine amidotransferase
MTTRPLIGVTTYREQARFGAWNTSADLLPATYARSVEAAGGVAVLLPPQNAGAADVVDRLDALIIAGGADLDPARYGAAPHPRTQTWRPDRDAWEWALLDAAEAAGRPVLGICRGMQLMAVRAGGTLEQHLPDVVGHTEHAPCPGAFGWTPIRTEPGSLVRQLVGDQLQVSCHHHQAVATHPASRSPRAPPTAPSRRSRTRNAGSGWRCSGTRSTATTTGCSGGWWRRPARAPPRPRPPAGRGAGRSERARGRLRRMSAPDRARSARSRTVR